jgi:site-specific recombinase XerD
MTRQASSPQSLQEAIALFLADMAKEQFSPHTLHDYSIDLKRFADFYQGPIEWISAQTIHEFFFSLSHLRPSSLARKRAAISSFLRWAYHHQLIDHNPMTGIPPIPRSRAASPALPDLQIAQRVMQVIPSTHLRDRIMFHLIGELGLRAMDVLTLQVEDVDLAYHPLRLALRRKVAIFAPPLGVTPTLDSEIRQYLAQSGYHHGPLFRAQKKKREEPLRFQSLHEIWRGYCDTAGVSLSLHDLRRLALTQQELWQLRSIGDLIKIKAPDLYQYLHQKPIQEESQLQATVTNQEPHNRQLIPAYLDIEALIAGAASEGKPWRYTELDVGYCTYVDYEVCPHRLACVCCGFYSPADEVQTQIRKPDRHIQRLLQELELSEAEQNIFEKKPGAEQQLREQLMDVPTPAGPTPRQLKGRLCK